MTYVMFILKLRCQGRAGEGSAMLSSQAVHFEVSPAESYPCSGYSAKSYASAQKSK